MNEEQSEQEYNERYSRQARFKPIGWAGQQQLARKHVLIVGAGALGSASAEALVRAGVGHMTIVDRDYVEWSNLQRQQLYTEDDVRERIPKAIAAQHHLQQKNSEVEIHAHVLDVRGEELESLISGVDLILDASDNFDTRFIINDVAQKHRIPWIYGACVGSYGISYTILPGDTPCLSCMMDLIPGGGESCDIDGIIAPAVQMVVANQSAEALKILTGHLDALHRKLVSFDLWANQFSRMNIQSMKKEACASCGPNATYPFLHPHDAVSQEKAAVLCGRDTVHIRPLQTLKLNMMELAAIIRSNDQVCIQIDASNSFLLSAMMEELRIVLFSDGRALVHGTNEVSQATFAYKQLLAMA